MNITPQNSVGRTTSLIALALVSSFFLFEFVARIEPSLAIGSIASDLGLTNAGMGTLSSLFFWVYAPMQLVVGVLLDRYGARRLIIPAIAVCSFGVIILGLATGPGVASVGRIMTGLGASYAFVSALYVVNHYFAPGRFALLSGFVSSIGMVGAAIGAVLLTDVIINDGWREVFAWTGGMGLGLCLLIVLFFRDAPISADSSATAPILAGLSNLFRSRRIWLISLSGGLYYMPVNVFGGLWGQSDLTTDHGLSPVSAELAVSMIFWGMAIGSLGVGAVSDWLGHRKWLIVSNALLAALFYGFVIYFPTNSVVWMGTSLFFAGVFGGAQMLTFAIAKEGAPASESGKIIAFVNMIGIASAIIFQPLVGALIDMSDGNFAYALSVIPMCLVAAAILVLFINEERHTDHQDIKPL